MLIIIQNWIDAIFKSPPLLSPGEEGVKALEISNAIYISSWLNETAILPIEMSVGHISTGNQQSSTIYYLILRRIFTFL